MGRIFERISLSLSLSLSLGAPRACFGNSHAPGSQSSQRSIPVADCIFPASQGTHFSHELKLSQRPPSGLYLPGAQPGGTLQSAIVPDTLVPFMIPREVLDRSCVPTGHRSQPTLPAVHQVQRSTTVGDMCAFMRGLRRDRRKQALRRYAMMHPRWWMTQQHTVVAKPAAPQVRRSVCVLVRR